MEVVAYFVHQQHTYYLKYCWLVYCVFDIKCVLLLFFFTFTVLFTRHTFLLLFCLNYAAVWCQNSANILKRIIFIRTAESIRHATTNINPFAWCLTWTNIFFIIHDNALLIRYNSAVWHIALCVQDKHTFSVDYSVNNLFLPNRI